MNQTNSTVERPFPAWMIFIFPLLFIVVFIMHFRHPADFFHFHLHYTPRDPAHVVTTFVQLQNHWNMFRDPHILGYLALPFLLVCAYALYRLSRGVRPRLSAIALFLTAAGTIYLGGIFGMWTAFYRGLGEVDPRYLDGAIATFRGMTAPHGAFLLTTTLGKLSMLGLAFQALLLWKLPGIPRAVSILIPAGCALFLAFWDLDNWMLIGIALIGTGFLLLIPKLRAGN